MLTLTGHAIVSADGMIADSAGLMPPPLKHEEDYRQFQQALDEAALVVLGRLGHVRHANSGRRRLVLTSSVPEIAADSRDPFATLWNPAGLSWAELCARLQLMRGTVAVTGGTRVFDFFLAQGLDHFVLAEVHDVVLPDGLPCFSVAHPRVALAQAGLRPRDCRRLAGERHVTLTHWSRG